MQQDALIAELQNGNPRAFERIYQLYSESTYGIIYSIIKDEKIAEEVLQDVFLKIWDKAPTYNSDKGRFFTWVLNIARNASIDKIRSKGFKNSQQNLKADNFVNILEDKTSFAESVDSIGLKKYIDKLKPVCKKLIDYLFFRGYTQKETSEELDMPLGTVKTRNRMCIEQLRKIVIK
ncbi:RNA polymerase sigma-70 factor, ECF subfamily [Salegentibacter echinorum]|uniref:RNA polymerase sigma-70 factor, ECF subfamily n=1 Tax=Salegentibacter echinorum TaxID=1073325 RepID=A0A1M5CET3_SALEC|nr:sigma-70 family RNA polymerase sigma factor [Salegentibacter echinorum]SHF53245.1 RNA polymerase sigma-70 factor, ECF subfamily [Salegentibacter echinorum]